MKFAKMPDEPPANDLGNSSQNEKTEDSTQSMSSEMSSDSSSGSASEDSDEEREKKLKMLQEQVNVINFFLKVIKKFIFRVNQFLQLELKKNLQNKYFFEKIYILY